MALAGVQMWFTFAVILAAVVALATERFRLEVICAAVIATFLIFFNIFPVRGPDGENLLDAEVLLSGLANPSLIAILALLVIGQGLFQTGALTGLSRMLSNLGGRRGWITLAVTMIAAASTSAVMNNTPVVVMFMPIVAAVSTKLQMSPSKTLMPLSFVAILGGMTTVIGSSTNLLAVDAAAKLGVPHIGFFDFTLPALVLVAVGLIYVFTIMPRLLVSRVSMADEVAGHSGRQFIAQIEVGHDHPLNGARSVAGMFPLLKDMTVRMIQRGEHPILPPFEDVNLRAGDSVIVAATRAVLTEALTSRTGVLSTEPPEGQAGDDALPAQMSGQLNLAEAVIAPGSRMIGRTVEMTGLHAETGCIVLGIQRRSRMIRQRLTDIRLEAGDVILVLGTRAAVSGLRLSRDLLLLEWSAAELPRTHKANIALGIFAAVVAIAATGVLPIVIAALAGAFLLVATNCLNVRQASRAFDRQIYLLIGASLAMAAPLEATGGAAFLASGVVGLFGGAGPGVLMSAMFALIAILTNILSNNATAVLFTPIAVNAAHQLGIDPTPFVVAVIFASNCSFATPIAYQTNLLVMSPGHYRFSDFLRAGTPLVVIMWLVFTLVGPWYYSL